MPKPKGTCGATKMKVMAVITHNHESGQESYGYDIWQQLKSHFYVYMNDNDIRNVYHHLNDLCGLGYIIKADETEECPKCYYDLTPQGRELRHRFEGFIDIIKSKTDQVLTPSQMRGVG
ncbi:MAG: helix-turn-helix transcriptional regulator [Candidatus Bathyarchaeota archaeon]|nr:helix-turn-helix transcriptional regulator [Candidatus Bathyarchaeota archaeon]